MELISNSVEKTREIAAQLIREMTAAKAGKLKNSQASVVALVGELGAGKTAFIQGLGEYLGVNQRILSPTFLIMRRFELTGQPKFSALYHFDFYRTENESEILNLGYEEIVSSTANLVVVEWADRFKRLMPKEAVWVNLEWLGEQKRKIKISRNHII